MESGPQKFVTLESDDGRENQHADNYKRRYHKPALTLDSAGDLPVAIKRQPNPENPVEIAGPEEMDRLQDLAILKCKQPAAGRVALERFYQEGVLHELWHAGDLLRGEYDTILILQHDIFDTRFLANLIEQIIEAQFFIAILAVSPIYGGEKTGSVAERKIAE